MSDRSGQQPLAAPRPSEVDVTDDAGERVISFRWFGPMHLFMAAFCVFWDGFLVFWYRTALSSGGTESIMFWFPLLHVGVGIGLTYSTICGFVNRTTIRIDGLELKISHGPLPWRGQMTLPRSDVQQIYREQTFGGRNQTASWHLSAVRRDDTLVRLLQNLPSPQVALYLEGVIESTLGIQDRRVVGEMPK